MKRKPEEMQVQAGVEFSKISLEEFGLYLRGLKVFHECRGKFGKSIDDLLVDILEQTNSPTEAIRSWDSYMGSRRVMVNLAARLKRLGEMEKLEELFRHLTIPDLVLPGEEFPGEALMPVVVFMFDPERTMTIMKWMETAPETDWFRYAQLGEAKCGLTPKIFELFPSIRNQNRTDWDGDFSFVQVAGILAGIIYCQDVLSTFLTKFKADDALEISKVNMLLNSDHIRIPADFPLKDKYPMWFYGTENDEIWRMHAEIMNKTGDGYLGRPAVDPYFAFAMKGVKRDVLRQFTREQQNRIAAWQFHLPRHFAHYSYEYLIGFHPEKEHSRWAREWPLFASSGTSHGYGAMLMVDPHQGVIEKYRCTNGDVDHPKIPERFILEGTYDNIFEKSNGGYVEYRPGDRESSNELERRVTRKTEHDRRHQQIKGHFAKEGLDIDNPPPDYLAGFDIDRMHEELRDDHVKRVEAAYVEIMTEAGTRGVDISNVSFLPLIKGLPESTSKPE